MNCGEVQAQLSDYLDKALPISDLQTIEAHLSACALCRTETDYLSECIQQVASLPIVDPPIGFTQRIMARVHEINERPGFWERWFLPLRVKIPLQATAVVLVGIFAVYLLEKEPSEKPPLMTSQAVAPANPLAPAEKNQDAAISKEESRPAKSQPLASLTPAPKTGANKTPAGAATSFPGRGKSPAERDDSGAPSSPPMEAKARGAGIVSGTPVISSGQLPEPFESKSGSLRPESMSFEPFADYEMVFRLPSSAQDQTQGDNLGLLQKPAASAVTAGYLERLLDVVTGSARPQTIWLTVSKSQYEQLKKQLRAVGTIESETQVPMLRGEPGDQNNGRLQIKLTVLPDPETKRAAPLSPGDK